MIAENRQLLTDEPVEIPRLQENYRSLKRNLWKIPQINTEKPKDVQHVTGWTCKHQDLNGLCPKISPITEWND